MSINNYKQPQTYVTRSADAESLSIAEERRLGALNRAGDLEARNRLVLSQSRFAVRRAEVFVGQGVDLDDLVAEAMLGLFHAASKYDERKGFRFGSYAVHWIRVYINEAIRKAGRCVVTPANVQLSNWKVAGVESRLSQTLGRVPRRAEVEAEIPDYTEERVGDGIRNRQGDVSLNEAAQNRETGTQVKEKIDSLADDEAVADIEARSEAGARRELTAAVLDNCDERSRDIVERFFGLNGYAMPQTLKAAGDEWGISRERARQIKDRTLAYLREDLVARPMLESLEEAV